MQTILSNCLFSLALLFFALSINAQDLIVTKEGDSLNCKITKIEQDQITFIFKKDDGIRKTLIPIGNVNHYQYKYYETSELPTSVTGGNKDYPHFRAALNAGLSYRLAKVADGVPSDFEQYVKQLKSGYHYALDLAYYFSEQGGIGFKYAMFRSKNEIDNIFVTRPDGSTDYGSLSDDIFVNFIGPYYSSRFITKSRKNSLLMNLGLGYMGYRDDAVIIDNYTLKGGTLGISWDIGYDLGISRTFALGFQIAYLGGILTQYELSDGNTTQTVELTKGNYESLSRIDLSIGLRFIR